MEGVCVFNETCFDFGVKYTPRSQSAGQMRELYRDSLRHGLDIDVQGQLIEFIVGVVFFI